MKDDLLTIINHIKQLLGKYFFLNERESVLGIVLYNNECVLLFNCWFCDTKIKQLCSYEAECHF